MMVESRMADGAGRFQGWRAGGMAGWLAEGGHGLLARLDLQPLADCLQKGLGRFDATQAGSQRLYQ
jgi:hypothetical protein